MGEVYRAYDERLHRRVALKQIRAAAADKPRVRERFLREARTAARLNHPALVQIHDILESDDGDWIVMELVEGTSLARLLKAGPLDPRCALDLARELTGGLAVAHAAGILHRDLKTENVVVTRDGHAKVLDFGLARTLEPDEDDSVTGEGRLLGTPRAMSPEQARSQDLDHRSDLFSLGTLLYEMVTGRSPFLAPGSAETLARVCHHEQDPARKHAPGVPQELSDLIDRLLAKEPSARPHSAAEVGEALARIAAATSGAGEPPPVTPEPAAARAEDRRTAAEDGEEPFHFRGERRRLTVLCCELTGAALDPELLFEVLPGFQSLASEAVERYEGHLRDLQGHRFVATFGYPRSHEDDARRAVLAALEVVTRSERTARGMVARAGVHTGPAVVLTRAAGEHLAMGETLDLATVLQDQAEPGSVLASAATRGLVAGFFAEEAAAPLRGPGRAVPIEACRMVAAREVHSRAEGAAEPPPAVGFEGQLGLLAGRFELAREGTGQAVLLAGEPGIGKTRLLRAFRDRFAAAPVRWVTAHGSPYARNLPLHPVAGRLRRLLEIDPAAAAERQLARLGEVLGEHDFSPPETVPLFAILLGLPTGGREAPALAQLRRDTLAAVPALVLEMAERRPLVLAFEDLHQVDPMTLELIGRLIDETPAAPLLLLLTCRPGFRPPWGHRPHLTRIALAPLSAAETGELIELLAAERDLPPAVRERILVRADGVPLFVAELVRDALARAAPASDLEQAEAIPAPLCGALTARLDGLGAARELARIAAVLGREISHDELAALSGLDEATLGHELARLLDAEILVKQDLTGAASYRFKRALVCEAAAASILAEDRQRLRRRIAALRGFDDDQGGSSR